MVAILILLAILLSGCSGGGGGGSSSTLAWNLPASTQAEKGDVEGYVYVEDQTPAGKLSKNSRTDWRRLKIFQKQPPVQGYTVVSGAVIEYKDDPSLSTTTDSNGYFKLKNVPQVTNPDSASLPQIIATPPSGNPNFQNVLPVTAQVASNPVSEEDIISLKVVPQRTTVSNNETHQFTALGKTASGKVIVRTGVTWSVTNNIGTIDTTGLFKSGAAEGTGEAVATLGGLQASAEVGVKKPSTAFGTISGKVTYADGSPVSSGYVTADGSDRVVRTGPDGSYELGLIPEGTWTVLVIFGGKTVAQGTIQVTGGQTATLNLTVVISSPLPYIESISPSSGAVGQTLTISGRSFGSSQGSSSIVFSGAAASVSSWGDTSIICTVPTGAVSGNILVTVNGQMSNPVPFAVIPPLPPPPQIASISPSIGQTGTSVTIAGSNFGSSQGQSTVTFGGVSATITSWSDTQIACTVPNAATTGPVVVTVLGQKSNTDKPFTVLSRLGAFRLTGSLCEFGVMDTTTGNFTAMGVIGDLKGWSSDYGFGIVGANLYVLGRDASNQRKLYVVDTSSGTLVKTVPAGNYNLAGFNASGSLIGFRWNGSQVEFGVIDTVSGDFAVRGTLGDLRWLAVGNEPKVIGNLLYTMGRNSAEQTNLYVADTVSGTLIRTIPAGGYNLAGVNASGHLIGFRYNGSQEEFGVVDTASGGLAVRGTLGDLASWNALNPPKVIGNLLYMMGSNNAWPGQGSNLYVADTVSGALIRSVNVSFTYYILAGAIP